MKFCIYIYNVYIDVRQETETKLTDYDLLQNRTQANRKN